MTSGHKRSEGLSLLAAIAFAVGSMVGAGVFVLSGMVISVAGPSAILSYALCGVLVCFSGLSYASLASIFPEDGGGYLYARRMLGDYLGFIAGWAAYVSMTIATAFVVLGFGIYLNLLLGTHIDPRLAALGAVLFLTLLNIRGLSEAGRAEVALVGTKLAILCLLVLAGLVHIRASVFVPFMPHGIGGLVQGMTMVFFTYVGFQVVAMMAGEVKESSRVVPIATLASIGIAAAVYIGVVVALLSAGLPSYGSESVFDGAVLLLGTSGGAIVALAAVLSTLSSANAGIIGASRITMEMACENQLPGRFARLRNGQPTNSILLGSAITILLIVHGNLGFIVDLTNVTVLISMLLVNISALVLMRGSRPIPPEKKYFRIPLGGLFPALGALSCVFMVITLPTTTFVMGVGALLVGTALYVLEDTPVGREAVEEIRRVLNRPSPYSRGLE